jgi:hypothetical protein
VAVERKYERDIDILLAEEFAVSSSFASWFLTQTKKFRGVKASVLDVYVSRSDNNGESDLVVVFERVDTDSRFALMIEDKIDAPLQPDQEIRYRRRGDAEVSRGDYSDYEVILCAPQIYYVTHPTVSSFDALISYESVDQFLKTDCPESLRNIYRANFIGTAARSTSNTWTRVDDDVTNAFWNAAYDISTREFPGLEMKPPELTKDSTWINIRPIEMPTRPRRIYVSLKGDRGFIDLTFTSSLARLFSPMVASLIDPDMTVHQTGKSAAIRIAVEGFNVSLPNEQVSRKIRNALAACLRLVEFYRRNRELLDKAASESLPSPARKLSGTPT